MYYLNKNLPNLVRTEYHESRDRYLRMDLNENPGGLDAKFIQDILSSITPQLISMYPEQEEFTQKLARYVGVEQSNICLTNGSAEAVRFIIEAFTQINGKIVSVTPSYAMYEVFANMYGRKHIAISYNDDLSFDVERIICEIRTDVNLLILVNPNNPIGNTYSDEEMRQILECARENKVTVLIDEAYHYFYPKSFIELAMDYERVFIVRTFSKLFSLAGCRLGYVVGRANNITMIRKLCTPHNINVFSMRLAEGIIDNPEMLSQMIKGQLEGKKYLVNELRKNGYKIIAQEGNFLFLFPNRDPDELVERMKIEKNILIKSYQGIGKYGKSLRISTGEKKYMKIFLEALLELDSYTGDGEIDDKS